MYIEKHLGQSEDSNPLLPGILAKNKPVIVFNYIIEKATQIVDVKLEDIRVSSAIDIHQ